MKKHAIICALICSALLISSALLAKPEGLTSYKEMASRLNVLAKEDTACGRNRLRVCCIGTSVQGREIIMCSLCDPKAASTKRLFVICRQHGDEPATTEAMLKMIRDLDIAKDADTADLLSKVSIFIVPMANPDGAEVFTRRNGTGTDLNRDWINLTQPETRAVRKAIDSVKPDVLLDEHELSPGNNRSDYLETASGSSGISPAVISESQHIENLVIGMLRVHGMPISIVHIEDPLPARLAHRYFAIHDGVRSLLFETRQTGGRENQLDYRMNLHITGTMTVAKYLAGQEPELTRQIARYESDTSKPATVSGIGH